MRPEDRRLSRLSRLLAFGIAPVSSSSTSSSDKPARPAMVSLDEKTDGDAELGICAPAEPCKTRLHRIGTALRLALLICCFIVLGPTLNLHTWLFADRASVLPLWSSEETADICPQASPIAPFAHSALLSELEDEFATQEFRLEAYELLGGAIRIPAVTYDDLGEIGVDPRWENLGKIHEYLEASFPLVHTTLKKTAVNTYGLVFHWQGTDESLKPILLTAHQDVVPVEPLTLDEWLYPPFSGYFDGEWIWGRGSCDDKPGLISTLIATETLIEKGFRPRRSVVLAFGFDEERGGIDGATAIRDYLLSTYGEYAFSMLVDEGGSYSTGDDGVTIASPAVAEKGKLDVRMEISTPGGHSSVPPAHTSIGMLAAMIKEIEANPHPARLNRKATYYQQLQCRAQFDSTMSKHFKKLVKKSLKSEKALHQLEKDLESTDRMFRPLAGTTQAIDIIQGGVKTNALPENVFLVMNHRIDVMSSVAAVQEHVANLVGPIATGFNLSLDAFGQQSGEIEKGAAFGHLQLSDAWGTALNPAPVTPTVGSGPYELLSGTIISAIGSSNRTGYTDKVFVSPGTSTGNTDTRHYWKLTKHIFRYSHMNVKDEYNGAHTVNEASRGENFIEVVRFHTRLILNADETTLLE